MSGIHLSGRTKEKGTRMTLSRALTSIALLWATFVSAEPSMKALIVDGQNNHNWASTTPVMKQQLEETGLFTVDVATSPKRG